MSTPRYFNERSVTVVDGEPKLVEALQRAAHAFRFASQSALTAELAIELLERRLTPLVVTDLHLAGRGGVWLVHEIRRRWPDVSLIVLASSDDEGLIRECITGGVQQFFVKPIHLDEFQFALHSTWMTQHLHRESYQRRNRLEQALSRQRQRLRSTFVSAVTALARTLEARDPYTSGHSQRVRGLSLRLADEIGLDKKLRRRLDIASKLHDIGKVGLAEGILTKPTTLTQREMELVRQHPLVGERILRPIIRDRDVLAAIRSHHERMDGGGYPDGLTGESIPLLARIITIADCFDALTTERPYRAALQRDAALEVLAAGAGTQFDPRLTTAFIAMVQAPARLAVGASR